MFEQYKTLGVIIPLILFSSVTCTDKTAARIQDFNHGWKFMKGDDSLAFSVEYDDSGWREINLPHDWSIEGEFSIDHPTGPAGGALPAGIGWYRKVFSLDENEKDILYFVDFDGIYRNSKVWINGQFLGERANGYISFSYELTPYLHFNGKENIIAVRVDNSLQPASRWYTGSGIYRNTWLRSCRKLHFSHWGTVIRTPAVSRESATVEVSVEIKGLDGTGSNMSLNASIADGYGRIVAESMKNPVTGPTGELTFEITGPMLWSVDTPELYILKTEIFEAGKKRDEQSVRFGIRDMRFDPDSGFYLNGLRTEIRGVNLHHDLGALGAAVNRRAIQRQLEMMKGMGVNAIRTAHNPAAPELLDLCDEMGLLVMEEAFDVWRKRKMKYDYHTDWEKNYRQDLRDMILRDRNHPCIFMWSIGNEIREQFDSTGITIAQELVSIVKNIDPARPVTCALTETDPGKNFIYRSGALDVLGFNYKHADWANFRENYPGEIMIATENMSAYSTRGHYDMPSDSQRYWPRKYGEDIIGANADFTVSAYDNVCAYWGASHEETLRAYYKNDFIAGLFIWSGIDFIGEPVPYEWPAKSSYYGVVDLAGYKKDMYYLYRSIWTDTPTLHVFPHWNWPRNKIIDIWAFYNQADEAELFLNGKSMGTKSKSPGDFHVMWRLEYEPGTVRVVSRRKGEKVLEKELHTAGPASGIELVADRSVITADGRDLSFVTARITDGSGILVPDAENLVEFSITGPGFIAGVDNGYQASHEPFKDNKRKAYNGLCLAIIQSDGEKGSIRLKARSAGLEPAELIINAN